MTGCIESKSRFLATAVLAAGLLFAGRAHAVTDAVFQYSSPQTRWLMINSAALIPVKTTDYTISNWGYIRANTAQVCFLAPVNLPHRAKMTSLVVWYSSNNDNDVIIDLWRQKSDTVASDQIVHLFPSPTAPDVLEPANFKITDPMLARVDNQRYAYHVHVCLANSAVFTRVRITYTYTDAGD
jgi:hypothetical protein